MSEEPLPEGPAERVRAVVERVVEAFDLDADVDVRETDDEIRATVTSQEDLGALIGKHGTTIDALQYISARAAFASPSGRKAVVVDAAGYRDRRATTLGREADRAAEDALREGRPIELQPMSAAERKVVHTHLSNRTDVETHSEGDEPNRRLVVSPLD